MLTQEQLLQVEKYVARKSVPYYDVRAELADHLGELVIGTMQREHVSFEAALQEQGAVFAADWEQIVTYKTRYLRLKFQNLFKKEFLRYFSWPKIALTVLLTALVFWLELNPVFHISSVSYLTALMCISYYFRRKDKHTTAFIKELKTMNKFRGAKRQVMIDSIRKKSTWLNLLSARQLTRVSVYFGCIELLYIVAVFVSVICHLDPLSRLVAYCFPVVVILTVAWQKVRLEIDSAIHKEYAHVSGG